MRHHPEAAIGPERFFRKQGHRLFCDAASFLKSVFPEVQSDAERYERDGQYQETSQPRGKGRQGAAEEEVVTTEPIQDRQKRQSPCAQCNGSDSEAEYKTQHENERFQGCLNRVTPASAATEVRVSDSLAPSQQH